MTWRAALLAVSVSLLLAPPALAGTASVENGVVTFRAAPGEANDVDISYGDGSYGISDRKAKVTAGPGCVADTAVQCSATGVTAVFVDLGDGDDRGAVGIVPVPSVMHGGPGNDDLQGEGTFFGDEGDDYVEGDNNANVLSGGPGHDWLEAQREDTVDCQGDADEVVKPSEKPKLLNCPGPPSVTVSFNHVSVKQLLAGKMKITIRCASLCASRMFLKITPPLQPYFHHGGDNLLVVPVSLDDAGFLKLAKTFKGFAFINGPSTKKALGRLHRFKLKLVVDAYTGQNVLTERTISVQVG